MNQVTQKHKVTLKPLEKNDFAQLHHWHSDLSSLHLWQVSREVLPYDDFVTDFEKRLRRSIDTLFIVQDADTGEPIGLVYNYGTSFVDGHTYLCLYISPDFAHKGFGLSAGMRFLEYLFVNCGFRKVYGEVFGYNHKVVRLAKMKGFEEEGSLRRHRYYANQYWDLHLLALYREIYMKRFAQKLDY